MNLCKLLEQYPDVFDAWRGLLLERMTGRKHHKEPFAVRREATRAQRIARLGRRR